MLLRNFDPYLPDCMVDASDDSICKVSWSLFVKQNFPVEKYTHHTNPKYTASTEYYRS